MDPSGDGGGGLTATGLPCGSCGTELPPNSKFCNECGAPVIQVSRSAEYKQVTVLFADVVHSMDIAAAVGTERLREIMTDLVNRAAVVVQRYGGTVGSFTGDGIMAVFGAPVSLEDHAVRACLAALGVQEEAKRLAVEVEDRDGVGLRLRVGLNSGQVIAGEIGSGPFGYTAAVDHLFREGHLLAYGVPATAVLVQTLLDRGDESDVAEAQAAIERFAAAPADEGLVIREVWLFRLRALLAKAHGDEASYCEYRDRYRAMAKSLGFEGHIAWAEAMP